MTFFVDVKLRENWEEESVNSILSSFSSILAAPGV